MSYGTQDSMILSIYDDELRLRPAVLHDERLAGLVLTAAEEAVAAVQQLGRFAANLAEAGGREASGPREGARLAGFARLDLSYPTWLGGLRSSSDLAVAQAQWRRTVAREISSIGDDLLRDAGDDALIGRKVNGKHLDAALADLWFRSYLRKNLTELANQQTPERTGDDHDGHAQTVS